MGRPEEALYACVRAREAIDNCRIKLAIDAPRSQEYYLDVLQRVDLAAVQREIARLRRQLYL